jgi:DinB superfamily
MTQAIQKLEALIQSGTTYLQGCPSSEVRYKASPASWSKQEILGHLIDSAINNLQRFTEIQFSEKPFPIRRYNQNQLVIINQYNDADLNELLQLWQALNRQIKRMMEVQNEETLAYAIILNDGTQSDLRFLMVDYVDHMEHHFRKVFGG